jgi:hypothetical protein
MLCEGPAWMLELDSASANAKLFPQQNRAAPRYAQMAVNFAHWRPCNTNVHNVLSPNNPSMCQKEKGVLVNCHVYFLKLSLLKIVGDILSRRSESLSRYIGGPPADSLHCRSFCCGGVCLYEKNCINAVQILVADLFVCASRILILSLSTFANRIFDN